MGADYIHDRPSTVHSKDGAVCIDGPEDFQLRFTPEAAEETSERLAEAAIVARGQRRMRNNTHRAI